MKTWSLLFNWQDGDREQGTFGTYVRAETAEEAERLGRIDMREHYIGQFHSGDDEDEIKEACELHEDEDGEFGGSMVECYEGAIWKAHELEEALRVLLAQVDEVARTRGWPDNVPREKARAIIAEIDGIEEVKPESSSSSPS